MSNYANKPNSSNIVIHQINRSLAPVNSDDDGPIQQCNPIQPAAACVAAGCSGVAGTGRLVRAACRRLFRRNSRSPRASGGSTAVGLMQQVIDPVPITDDEPTGDLQLQQLTSRALSQVQSEFETRTWHAFWRSVVDGIASSEVAKELNMSEATVRQSRSRILRRLRQQLGDVM